MPLFYEDLEVGRRFESASRVVSEADIRAFADLSGDRNPLHLDPLAARAAGFEGTVAHGVLGLSVATGLASRLELTQGTLVALTGVSWRFRSPIYPGDTVTLHFEVGSRRATRDPRRGLVVLAAELKNQRGAVVQEGEFVELVKRRPESG